MSDSARFNMIEAQIRTADVTDPRIHAAMGAVAREKLRAHRRPAPWPMPMCRWRWRRAASCWIPRSFAKLLQLARCQAGRPGAGCGLRHRLFLRRAGRGWPARWWRWSRMPIWCASPASLLANARARSKLMQGGLIEGFKGQAPYDVIFVNGAIEQVPDTLLAQLAEGGRLVAVLKDGQGRAWLFVKEKGQIGQRPDFDADVPLLAGFKKAMGFIF